MDSCRRLLRLTSDSGPSVTSLLGLRTTAIYDHVKRELLTPPIRLTQRSSAWPEDEISAVITARIAGKSEDQIRALVRSLVAARAAEAA